MAVCKACEDPLVFQTAEEDNDNEQTVPDDLELQCGCHFHWQCLLDEPASVAVSLQCPSCGASLPSNNAGASSTNPFFSSPGASVFARYTNEGGLQPNLDILPAITEEAYLLNQPEARPARAFQVMCAEGDVEGMVELLAALDEDEDEIASATSILQYQDPLSGQKSSLHIAVENAQVDVALLLLWLSSTAPPEAFPDVARQTAERFGLSRLTAQTGDIRLLKDSNGLTAEQYAQRTTGPFVPLLESGLLSPGA